MNISKSISAKILVSTILITAILAAMIVAFSAYNFSRFANESFEQLALLQEQIVADGVGLRIMMATDQANGLTTSRRLIEAVKAVDRDGIQQAINEVKSMKKSTFFTILDTEGKVIFCTDRPGQFGDSQTNLRTVSTVLTTRESCFFFDSTPSAPMSVRAGAPIFCEEGNFIGIVTNGFRLDNDFVDEMQGVAGGGAFVTVFLGDTRVATTLRATAGSEQRATGTRLENREIVETVLTNQQRFIGTAYVQGRPHMVVYSPLGNPGDTTTLGMGATGIPLEPLYARQRGNLMFNIALTLVGLLISIGTIYWIVQGIVKPLKVGEGILRAISEEGDIHVDIPQDIMRRQDEVGTICRSIEAIVQDYRDVAALTEKFAAGDWQATVKEKGPYDLLHQNLEKMIGDVNRTLREIAGSVTQVASSSGEVSSAAQSLADGSQESAASLQQITASMHEISSQTKMNAESATQARNLAQKASKAAIDGQGAMNEMTTTMGQITQNSNEIQRVIKVIDDIAFQTNLLALNAAVEAARAGQHGKGFAVVAEEVRNLASRSAKAAKETADLIAKSGHEIEKGGEVATRTAEMLNTIVDQIKQTTDLVAGIAVASNEQALGVNQVTTGLQQIDSVTQQNTAVAEQSASAANEMSSMAAALQKSVGHFKLR